MDSFSVQMCRLCLESTQDTVNIFEKFQCSTIASVLTQHFRFQVHKDDGFSAYLCQICWINTKTFHNFYERVKRRQKDSWHLAKVQTHVIENEPSDGSTMEFNLNLVKNEIADPLVPEIDFQIIRVESSYNTDNFSCDPNENVQMKNDVEDSNLTENRSPVPVGNPSESNDEDESDEFEEPSLSSDFQGIYLSLSEKNAKIRQYFSMVCRLCSEPFETFGKAKKHYRAAHNIPGYVYCCDRKFHRHSNALSHIIYHLNPNAYCCDTCDKRCTDKFALHKHIKSHKPKSTKSSLPFECDLCPRSFTTKNRLLGHTQLVHCPVKCDQCDVIYESKSKLLTHLRNAHQSTLAIPHVCDICGKDFSKKYILHAHMRSKHSTTKQNPKFQCDICGARSRTKPSIARHLERHVDNPAKCSVCSKVMSNQFSLKKHIRYVHTEKRHQCTICDKKFRTRLNLKEHIACHTGQDLYECGYCTRTFKSSANLYSHRKKMHLAKWTEDCSKRCNTVEKISGK